MIKIFHITLLILFSTTYNLKAQDAFSFNDKAIVNSCGHAFLQKISADNQADLSIKLDIDMLKINKKINIEANISAVNIIFIKYSGDNKIVPSICNTQKIEKANAKALAVFRVISGTIYVKPHKTERRLCTFEFKNLILKNDDNLILELPKEVFTNVQIGWGVK